MANSWRPRRRRLHQRKPSCRRTSATWPPSSHCRTPASACGSVEKRTTRKKLASFIELRVAAEDAVLVERNAPGGGEVGREPLAACDPVMQFHQPPMFLLESLHRLGKSVTQALDHLEE